MPCGCVHQDLPPLDLTAIITPSGLKGRAASEQHPVRRSGCSVGLMRRSLCIGTWTGANLQLALSTSRFDLRAEPCNGSLNPALAMGNAEGLQCTFDHAERTEHHWRVDMTHMGDAERLV
jgi:hypothetical protein